MRESIESWKAILLCVEMFCLGGSLFADEHSASKSIMNFVMIIIGIVLISTS